MDWEVEASRLEGIYFNRGGPHGNDAATCAAALFEAIRLYTARNKPIPAWVGRELLEAYDMYQDGREPSCASSSRGSPTRTPTSSASTGPTAKRC